MLRAFRSKKREQNSFSSLEIVKPVIKTRKSNKVTLYLSGSTKPRIIHITGMTIPQIQRTFKVGSNYGWDQVIQSVTIG